MKLIIINGPPGSGKSTLATRLSKNSRLPVIGKDMIKEFLFELVGIGDLDWSKKLGRESIQIQKRLARLMLQDGRSVILESAFQAAFARPELMELVDEYNPDCLEIYCEVSPEVLRSRLIERNERGERHAGHVDSERYGTTADYDKYDPLNISEIIRVDTSKSADIDYDGLLESIILMGS